MISGTTDKHTYPTNVISVDTLDIGTLTADLMSGVPIESSPYVKGTNTSFLNLTVTGSQTNTWAVPSRFMTVGSDAVSGTSGSSAALFNTLTDPIGTSSGKAIFVEGAPQNNYTPKYSGGSVTWAAQGAGISYDIDTSFDTTNDSIFPIFTNTVAIDSTAFHIVDVVAAGPTNFGSYRVSCVLANHDNTGTISTNQIVEMESSAGMNTYWSQDGSNSVLSVIGMADENIHWIAKGTIHTSTNGLAAAGGPTWQVNEDCEGVGKPTGWTDVGTAVNWDGTGETGEGVNFPAAGAQKSSYFAYSGGGDEYYAAWVYLAAAPSGNTEIMSLKTNTTTLAYIRLNTAKTITAILGGSAGSTTSDAIPDTTWVAIRLHYVAGTGSDAYCEAEWSTDGTFSGSGTKYSTKTGGAQVDGPNRFQVGVGGSVTLNLSVDKIRGDDVEINPL